MPMLPVAALAALHPPARPATPCWYETTAILGLLSACILAFAVCLGWMCSLVYAVSAGEAALPILLSLGACAAVFGALSVLGTKWCQAALPWSYLR